LFAPVLYSIDDVLAAGAGSAAVMFSLMGRDRLFINWEFLELLARTEPDGRLGTAQWPRQPSS
jgi:hypothetical protein